MVDQKQDEKIRKNYIRLMDENALIDWAEKNGKTYWIASANL